MKKHVLTILAFVVVSFAAQGLSHFVINVDHFAAIPFMRQEPILLLGIAVMLIQGLLLSVLYARAYGHDNSVRHGIEFGLIMGLFLVSYIALVEPSKYTAPSISSWIAVEGSVGFVQFGVFGLLLGFIHRRFADSPTAEAHGVAR